MGTNETDKSIVLQDRFQNILNTLSQCKINYSNEKEECKKMRENISKLELELKESRELERSHRYHLVTSREMISNLQETVSQLVYLKRDMKKLKDEIAIKETACIAADKDKEIIIQKHNENIEEIRRAYNKQIEELINENEMKIQQIQHESDTQIAQFTCVIEELRSNIKDMETEHRDKINVVVLDYEEKIQRESAQTALLRDQLARQAARSDASVDAYRRRLEDLEEKLKQKQFKEYLAHGSYAYDGHERSYSEANTSQNYSVDLNPVRESCSAKTAATQNRTPKVNTLQFKYQDSKPIYSKNVEKKGPSNAKKRKLYSDSVTDF